MKTLKTLLEKMLAHPAWSGIGVLVAVITLVVSMYQNSEVTELNSKEESIKAERLPFFVSQRIALVIGNSNYDINQAISATRGIRRKLEKIEEVNGVSSEVISEEQKQILNSTITSLKNPINDAKAMVSVLKEKNFKVISGFDVTKEQLIKLVEDFQTILATGGTGVFFYAGHAINVDDVDYILPITADDVSTQEKFIAESVNITEILKPVEQLIDEHPNNTGSIVVYAASKGQPAFDGKGDNSPFTTSLISSLRRGAKSMGLFDVFTNVAAGTTRKTDNLQIPWFSGYSYANFYFNDQGKDKDVGLMKILFIDACRDNPFEYIYQ